MEIAVRIEVANVTSGEPAIGIDGASLAIFTGDLGAAHVNLAPLAGGQRLAVGTSNFDLHRWQRLPHGTQAPARFLIVARHRLSMVLRAKKRDGGTGLRQSVGVREINGGEQIERSLNDADRHVAAAVSDGPERPQNPGSRCRPPAPPRCAPAWSAPRRRW